jgi:hypothetical protein
VPLDFVWLRLGRGVPAQQTPPSAQRPLRLRLSIAPSIAIHWASKILALSDHASAARERHTLTTLIVRSWAGRRAGTARVADDGVRGSAWDGLKAVPANGSNVDTRSESWRSLLHAVPTPWTLRTSRRVDARGSLVALRSPIHSPETLRWTRVPANAGRFAGVPMAAGRRRLEPRVLAPPPMVGRTAQRTAVSSASQARQETREFHSPLGFATDERSGWMPAAGALSPAVLASVTDHVVREIDSRVRAKRERLGKV